MGKTRRVSDSTARGVIAMMALVFVFQAVTFTIHKCSKSKEERPPAEIKTEEAHATLFAFNPNTITIDSLQLLGLTQKQALTIIHYREKGGRFRKKEDFSKMYTVSPEKYLELEPYIVIPVAGKRPEPKAKIVERPEVKQEEKPAEKPEQPKKESEWKAPKEKVFVDLNEADSAALISVKGIGPYFCKAILSYRKALGSFANIDQLLEIRGMDQEKFDRIKDQVFVHPGGIKKFSIAEADENFLRRHPYIGAYNARGIALFIQSQGKEKCTLKSLCENNILSAQDTLRLHPYME
ncbi:MAG: helix-hairpin-helix domain-containing protein [Bacteroidales bacterium]|nr:helix-hairpin-helix domain-containing protein [Bacteroidales bacterium]